MEKHVGRGMRLSVARRVGAESAGRTGRVAKIMSIAVAVGLMAVLTGCGQEAAPEAEDGSHLTIAALKGPTSVSMAPLIATEADEATATGLYSFDIQGSADAIVPKLVQGEVDIALIPANLAATLYQKTQGGITVIDINTLGVLSAVSQGQAKTFGELKGKTVYMTGKGAVPEYTMDALLAANDISENDLTLEFKSEPAEVVAAISADADAIGILPQPYVTAATLQNPNLTVDFNLTDVWDSVMGPDAGKLLTAVTVVRTEVLEEFPGAVQVFLADHAASVDAVTSNPEAVASQVVDAGLSDNEALVAAALPACNVVCLTGQDMKAALSGYLKVLVDVAPEAIGGSLPEDDFYYVG